MIVRFLFKMSTILQVAVGGRRVLQGTANDAESFLSLKKLGLLSFFKCFVLAGEMKCLVPLFTFF